MDLYRLTLRSGFVYRWTTADLDLVVSGNTFRTSGANGPLIQRSAVRQSARLSIDTVDITLTGGSQFLVGGKSLQLLATQGYFDGARLQIDHLVGATPGDLSLGAVASWFEGRIAIAEPVGPSVLLRVKSELEALNQILPRFRVQASCGNTVYDANCTLNRGTFTLTGTVSAAASSSSFTTATPALTAKAAGYFNLGVVSFFSGALNGQSRAITDWNGSVFTLALPFTATPGVGDSFLVFPGCDRQRPTCQGRFNNLVNFRGFPHVPKIEGGGK